MSIILYSMEAITITYKSFRSVRPITYTGGIRTLRFFKETHNLSLNSNKKKTLMEAIL